jgi:hypothetical protein
MKRHEFITDLITDANLYDYLIKMDAEGWDVVVCTRTTWDKYHYKVIMRRPVVQPDLDLTESSG